MAAKRLAGILRQDRNTFGLVRLAAAAAVVVSHAVPVVLGPVPPEPLHVATGFPLGAHAVHIFFVLSGLLVAGSWERNPHLLPFLLARGLRVYPALIAVTLLLAFGAGPLLSALSPAEYLRDPQLIRFLSLSLGALAGSGTLPGVFADAPLAAANLPVWTLKYEVACYLALAGLGALGIFRSHRLSGVVLGGLLVLALAAFSRGVPYDHEGVADHMLRLGFAFLLGVVAWRLRRHLPLSLPLALALLLLAVALLHTPLALPAQILATGYAALLVSSLRLGGAGAWTRRYDISYGLYILAWPVQQVLGLALPQAPPAANAALTLLLVTPLAFASWMLVEAPAQRSRAALLRLLAALARHARLSPRLLPEPQPPAPTPIP